MKRFLSTVVIISMLLSLSLSGCKDEGLSSAGSNISAISSMSTEDVKKDEGSSSSESDISMTSSTSKEAVIKTLNGAVQKGPYLNGTSLTFFELTEALAQTGKSYNGQIKDNTGTYTLKNISFTSNFVMIKADGYYFNEVSGETSASVLTLYALSDITNKNTVNVNLISHLEKDRVEYLVETGLSFIKAKKQAQVEILKVFSLTMDNAIDSELLSINEAGDNNAKLLAISVILQGERTTAELSELLANISTDIRTDGILNSKEIGTQLINDSRNLNLKTVRDNLVKRYAEIGLSAEIPAFETYVDYFNKNSIYKFTKEPTFPAVGSKGHANLLGPTTDFELGFYDVLVEKPEDITFIVKFKLFDESTPCLLYTAFMSSGQGIATGISLNEKGFFEGGIGVDTTDSWSGIICMTEDTRCESEIVFGLENSITKTFSGPDQKFILEYYINGQKTPYKTKVITIHGNQ